jgi:hypothetical protein
MMGGLASQSGLLSVASTLLWSPFTVAYSVGSTISSLVGLAPALHDAAETMHASNTRAKGKGGISTGTGTSTSDSPIGDRCLCVLNLLLHNERCTAPDTLPLQLALAGSCRSLGVEALISRLGAKLPDAGHTLLLYTLLNSQPSFLRSLQDDTTHLQKVVIGILHGMYDESTQGSVEHHCLLSVCVLILSQEANLRPILVETKGVLPWYKERNFHHASSAVGLADAIILCVLRALMHVVMRLKDPYLASNYFAVLLNISPFINDIHSYTAERLVGVTHKLAKRLSSSHARAQSGDVGSPLMEETLRVLFRSIWLCVKCTTRCINLQYVLARDFLDIEVSFSDPYISQLCDGADGGPRAEELVALSAHYLELVKVQQTGGANASQTLSVLTQVVPEERESSLSQVMVYNYEEGSGAAAYFVPFVWETVLQISSDLDWSTSRITLLTVGAGAPFEGGETSSSSPPPPATPVSSSTIPHVTSADLV